MAGLRFKLCRTEDGIYFAVDSEYPYVGHPESYGTKQHAETYIANWYGLTLKEYRNVKRQLKEKG